jgi:hypothetical protein
MFTLEMDEGVEFLGPMTHAMVVLRKNHGFTPSQAREGVLQAFFNGGDGVHMGQLKHIAKLIKRVNKNKRSYHPEQPKIRVSYSE